MRRMVFTSLAFLATAGTLAVTAPAAGSKTPLTLTKIRADWIGSTRQIFVDTTWAPKRFETRVTVKISVNGNTLRTLHVSRWVIGHKLFKLTVPTPIPAGSKARIEATVSSQAGRDHRTVKLDLQYTPDPADPS